MKESFYQSIITKYKNKPLIIYPCSGIEKIFNRNEQGCIEQHILDLFEKYPTLTEGTSEYFILILWDNEGDRMTDVWIFGQLESWGSGPLVDVNIFRNYERETTIGVSAGDGLVLLGREEEQRRNAGNFDNYIHGPRPILPEGINPKENFYL